MRISIQLTATPCIAGTSRHGRALPHRGKRAFPRIDSAWKFAALAITAHGSRHPTGTQPQLMKHSRIERNILSP